MPYKNHSMPYVTNLRILEIADIFISRRECTDFMKRIFNVIVEQGEDGYLISDVVELPGCHTQAKTYDELIERTREAILLNLEARKPAKEETKFVSLQQIEG